MKKSICTLIFIVCAVMNAKAQSASGAAPMDPLLKGKDLLKQLISSLDASTFLNSWTDQDRTEWYKELSNASDAPALSKCISEFSEYIKPVKFKEQFSLAQLKGMASETKNYGDVAYVLGALESGLNSDAFNNDWVSKEPSWLGELKLVK
jgi:hypothetical protein